MSVLSNIEPAEVFKYFEEISAIPRGSGNTKAISDYCVSFAKERGLFYVQDEVNNVIIRKPATPGREKDNGVIIQGHLDMVAEKKPGSEHDFLKDGLKLYVEDGLLKARDTTLGGDDGIAVAMGLAILDSHTISHPALEVIFTIDEEVGMDGARALDMSTIEGKYMLNLDSEEEGIFIAGCAGGARVTSNISYRTVMTEGTKCIITVSGLKGGHSGVEIHKERANADVLLARILKSLADNVFIECISISGGNKDNAIPREATAQLLIDKAKIEDAGKHIEQMEAVLKNEFASSDSGLKVVFEEREFGTYTVMVPEDFKNILFYINNIPNGVINMNPDISGLVETSLNLGIVMTENNCFTAVSAVRSSVGSRRDYIINKLNDMAEMSGGFAEVRGEYPEWSFKKDSYLRDMVTETYKEMFGKEPVTDVIHAGLECGYISSKRPEIDIVAMGPDIYDIHTTEERMSIASVERVYKLVIEVLKKIH